MDDILLRALDLAGAEKQKNHKKQEDELQQSNCFWQKCGYLCATSLRTADLQLAACCLHPMTHARQSMASRTNILDGETLAIVLNLNGDVAVKVMQADFYLSGFSIFGNIGQ